ncbi:MAG: hypothetical protein ACT4PO_05220 [Actinomycetota bacterium]
MSRVAPTVRQVGIFAVASTVWALGTAGTATAAITKGPCDGSVTIRGTTYTPANDTPGNPVVVPNEAGVRIRYFGTTGSPLHNHTGAISVVIGPGSITVANWSGQNDNDEVEKEGPYNLDDAYAKLPLDIVGLFRVEGFHFAAKEGVRCEGFAYVKIEGNPLATVPGAAAAVLTIVSAVGVAVSGMVRKAKP